ncbi:MAG: RluA family pseudouridine synthase [Candidatus Omnitrophica bacterium]|nr:RluA family pseudouridine synthase [Candidatus Omnitrophota bacterium]
MEKEAFKFEVTELDKGKRLDKFLVENLPKLYSRTFIQKLISDQSVLVNGISAKRHHNISAGETIDVKIPESTPSRIEAEDIPLDIVYEDKDLLVVNKPVGMVVHPAPGNYTKTLVNALLAHSKDLSGIGGVAKPGIVHRIDKDTSGLLVVAKSDEAHNALSEQFRDKTTKRVYIALVKGVVELDNGIVELPIARSRRDRKKMAVDFENSKEAVTRYKVLKRFKDFTQLEVTLGTGRTHQIRVHMSYIGHPILGDAKYGSRGKLKRPALHAKVLGFVHPKTGRYMEFTSDLPEDMKELIAAGSL